MLFHPQRMRRLIGSLTYVVCLLASNASAQALPSGPAESMLAIVSGGITHTCARAPDGGVQCWGQGNRLGLAEDADNHATPVRVAGLPSVVRSVVAGNDHTCALTAAGGVMCWSDNTFGELGDGSTDFRAQPVAVAGLTSGVVALGAGDNDTCAVLASGGIKCWGTNDFGELGDATTIERDSPVDVAGLDSAATAVTSRLGHTCALLATGAVECWGRGLEGELDNGSELSSSAPVFVSGLTSGAIGVAAGSLHTCAALATGGVKCWGQDDSGEVGDGTFSPTNRLKPVNVLGLTDAVVAITAGNAHTCVLTKLGGVKCWGTNNHGQLGDGTTIARNTPVNVVGLQQGVKAIGAGYEHTCAVLTSGAIVCWGDNPAGQLGDGSFTQRPTPVAAQSLRSIWVPLLLR